MAIKPVPCASLGSSGEGFFPLFLSHFLNDSSTRSLVAHSVAGQTSTWTARGRAGSPISPSRSVWTGAAHGCPVQTLESMAKDLLGEQMRLYVEIGDLELATREPLPSAPSPPAPTTVDGRAPKKAKMVQSTLVGFVLSSQRRRSHYPHAAPRTESY